MQLFFFLVQVLISLPLLSHAPGLSGNIFPQALVLCSLLTVSLVDKAWTVSCRERKERQKNVQETPQNNKTWPATFDRAVEKDSPKSWGPCQLLPWCSPRRWLLTPKKWLCFLIWVELLPSWVWTCSLLLPGLFIFSSLHKTTDESRWAQTASENKYEMIAFMMVYPLNQTEKNKQTGTLFAKKTRWKEDLGHL